MSLLDCESISCNVHRAEKADLMRKSEGRWTCREAEAGPSSPGRVRETLPRCLLAFWFLLPIPWDAILPDFGDPNFVLEHSPNKTPFIA